MTDFQIRSDNVDVEQIMRQIRSRIREKRGVDYTEEEIRELARVKLEKFLDPTGVRSDLLAQFRRANAEGATARNFRFEDTTLYESSRGWLRAIRKMLQPILKLFFNPNPLVDALHIQSELNDTTSKRGDLQYELIHNLVLETTRLGIQVRNLRMQVESMSSRLDFDERRARALEGVVQYRPGAVSPLQPSPSGPREGRDDAAAQERRSRRRRRRGRRPASARDGSGASFGEAGAAREGSGGSVGEAGSAREGSGGSVGAAGSDRDAGSGETYPSPDGETAPGHGESGAQDARAESRAVKGGSPTSGSADQREPVSPDSRGITGGENG